MEKYSFKSDLRYPSSDLRSDIRTPTSDRSSTSDFRTPTSVY